MNRVQILATGSDLVGDDIRGFEPVVEELIRDAREEIQMLAYILTPSAGAILSLLLEASERGVMVTVIVNRKDSQEQSVRTWLDKAGRSRPRINVLDFSDARGSQLHAKVIVADRKRAVVGSANFSWGGLVTNYEIGVLLEGEVVWVLAGLVDRLAASLSQSDKVARPRRSAKPPRRRTKR
jgi:cardiolipin synthase